MEEYSRAAVWRVSKKMKDPFVILCLGVALLNLAASRTTKDKNQALLKAFACFNQYEDLVGPERSAESTYNVARAFHQISLFDMAVTMYHRVIEMDSDDSTTAYYKRLSAYNTTLIYNMQPHFAQGTAPSNLFPVLKHIQL